MVVLCFGFDDFLSACLSTHVSPLNPFVCVCVCVFCTQGVLLAVHYALLATLVPLPVAIGHIFLGGWLTATIVTVTHTAEEYVVEDDSSYVETQFKTTRDAVTRDPLSE